MKHSFNIYQGKMLQLQLFDLIRHLCCIISDQGINSSMPSDSFYRIVEQGVFTARRVGEGNILRDVIRYGTPPIQQIVLRLKAFCFPGGSKHPDPRTPFPARITSTVVETDLYGGLVLLSGDFRFFAGNASYQYRLIWARQPQRITFFSLL